VAQVQDEWDDAEQNPETGAMYMDSSDLELTEDPNRGTPEQLVGMRFALAVPRGAVIHAATLRFTVDEVSTGSASLHISGELSPDSAAFSDADFDLSRRTRTAASVDWSPTEWTVVGESDAAQTTPELGSVVEELVNQSAWVGGNHITLFIEGSGERTAESYDGAAGSAPVLRVLYSEGAATSTCGDAHCDSDETCHSCEEDCGACPTDCGDGTCEGSETCSNCQSDCGTCPPSSYVDDTFEADDGAPGEVVGSYFDYGAYLASGAVNAGAYDDYDFVKDGLSGRYVLDIIGSHFLVDNNDEDIEPTESRDNSGSGDPDPCEDGAYPTNRYPFTVREDNVTVRGGVLHGYFPGSYPHIGVPQTADWDWAYCNSAALLFHGVAGGHSDGVRITSAWDAIRVGPNWVVENAWLSHVHDDLLENDNHQSGVFKDSLVDGTFQGLSQRDDTGGGADQTVVVSGSVIRIQAYPYKVWRDNKDQRFGALFKTDAVAPRIVLKNTVVAIDPDAFAPGGSTHTYSSMWDNTWLNVDVSQCENNVLLWMPSGVGGNESDLAASLDDVLQNMPSACFTRVETDPSVARALWLAAKQNWIDCHPLVGRMAGDPASDFNRCTAGEFGGFGD
jgi:hypothetical protein